MKITDFSLIRSQALPDSNSIQKSTITSAQLKNFCRIDSSSPHLLYQAMVIVRDNMQRYNAYDNDILQCGTVTILSSVFPTVDVPFGTDHLSLNVSSVVSAGSASNKSLLKYVFAMIRKIDDFVISDSKRIHQEWEMKNLNWKNHQKEVKKHPDMLLDESLYPGEEPSFACFSIPLNVSKSMVVDLLKANQPYGNVFIGTEVLTYIEANRQQYGQMEDTLNQSLANEDVEKAFRIDGEKKKVEDVKATFLASGVEEHVHTLIPNFTSGIGSRIFVYNCPQKAEKGGYKDQQPVDSTVNYKEIYNTLSEEVFSMWQFFLDYKFTVNLSQSQWKDHFATASADYDDVVEYDTDLAAIAKRAPQLIVKVAALHHMLKLWDMAKADPVAFEARYPKGMHHFVECDDDDYAFGKDYEQVMFSHTMMFATTKVKHAPVDVKPMENWRWYIQVLDELADKFTAEQYIAIASIAPHFKCPKTCYHHLKELSQGTGKLIRKTKERINGKCVYVKIKPKG